MMPGIGCSYSKIDNMTRPLLSVFKAEGTITFRSCFLSYIEFSSSYGIVRYFHALHRTKI